MKNKSEYGYILNWSKKIKAINLLGGKCQECGEDRPWLLSFHHKDQNEKEFIIAKKKSYRWSIIEKEILKCDLLCERCHREIHEKRTLNDRRHKGKIILLNFKNIFKCETCQYNKSMNALDFHHIIQQNKKYEISDLIMKIKSVGELEKELQIEINKCKVLCANCHKELHFDKEKFKKFEKEIRNWQYKELQPALNKELILQMYNNGMKQHEIRKKLKCAKSTISGIIKKYNSGISSV